MYTHHYYRENEADRILAPVARDQWPHYRTETIVRKARKDRARGKDICESLPERCEATSIIRWLTLRRVLRAARLTQCQAQVLSAKTEGHTWNEIGRRFGYTKQAAQGIFKQAIRKVRRAWRTYPYTGLEEVYRQEVGRVHHRHR